MLYMTEEQEDLNQYEITAACCGHQLPVTLDTVATVTILPKELVDAELLKEKMLQTKL